MAGQTVVVLGGGIGGVVAANRLRRRLAPEDRVVLVEREPVFRFASSFLRILTGERRPEQISAPLGRLRRRGIELVAAEARTIDTAARRVETTSGPLGYDRLLIAAGAELAPELLPGFAEAALNMYTLEGAVAAGLYRRLRRRWRLLPRARRGHRRLRQRQLLRPSRPQDATPPPRPPLAPGQDRRRAVLPPPLAAMRQRATVLRRARTGLLVRAGDEAARRKGSSRKGGR